MGKTAALRGNPEWNKLTERNSNSYKNNLFMVCFLSKRIEVLES